MAFYLTVANRKGGVGKSTVAILLAQAFSVWGKKRVLLVDLDSQCNASMILIGGDNWYQAKQNGRTIADFIKAHGTQRDPNAEPLSFLTLQAGDVLHADGSIPNLALLAGSVILDEVEGELFFGEIEARADKIIDLTVAVRQRVVNMLREFDHDFDLVVIDSAPGLSLATQAALEVADKVIVPFRADVVSQMAVDRVAMLIERQAAIEALAGIPFPARRYMCLANFVRQQGRERLILEEIGLLHPVMTAHLRYRDELAGAFDWFEHRRGFETKYGAAVADIEQIYKEIGQHVTFEQRTHNDRVATDRSGPLEKPLV